MTKKKLDERHKAQSERRALAQAQKTYGTTARKSTTTKKAQTSGNPTKKQFTMTAAQRNASPQQSPTYSKRKTTMTSTQKQAASAIKPVSPTVANAFRAEATTRKRAQQAAVTAAKRGVISANVADAFKAKPMKTQKSKKR